MESAECSHGVSHGSQSTKDFTLISLDFYRMEMYGFELHEGLEDVEKAVSVGDIENSLLWLIFRGESLEDEHEDNKIETASMVDSVASTVVETGIAREARVVRPRLLLIRAANTSVDEKPLPATPKEVEAEDSPSPALTLEEAVRVRLEKRNKANNQVFNRFT